jgi:hypothetical protein
MWNEPTPDRLKEMPDLYSSEDVNLEDKIIVEHFFIGGFDWYIAESDDKGLMFGFVNLNDPQMAEWGYVSLNELKEIKVAPFEVDRDLHWTPKKFSEINWK